MHRQYPREVPPGLDQDFVHRVRARLRDFGPEPAGHPGLVAAAVAVVLLPNRNGVPCFLLTRRAASLSRNSGQWALPGGRRDPGETPAETARRELGEELGMDAREAEDIGRLDDYVTRSGYSISPVVFLVSRPARLRPSPDEVAGVYRVPLQVLDTPAALLLERRQEGVSTLRYRILGRLINPPTAAILHQLSEVVFHARHTRVADFVQPEFTWK